MIKGQHLRTPECIAKQLMSLRSPETRAKLVASHMGKHATPEARAKIAAWHTGTHLSPETKAKLSDINKHRSPEWQSKLMAARCTPEARERTRTLHKGKHLTPETKAKISMANKGQPSWNKGNHYSLETKAKIGAISKERWANPECRAKMTMAIKQACNTPEWREKQMNKRLSPEAKHKISIAHQGKTLSPEHKAKISAKGKGRHPSAETIAKRAAANKGQHRTSEAIANMIKGVSHKQTKPEKIVEIVLNEVCPKEYKYVGSDGSVVLNHCVPDFINMNHEKKAIEVFGEYWHGLKVTGRTREQEEIQRLNKYAEVGFDCLIIWESETKKPDLQSVKERIKAFRKMKHSENQPYLI